MMYRYLVSLLLLCSLSGYSSVQAAEAKTVTVLDRGELYEGMAFHAGYLFVGKSRTDFNSDYRVEIYGPDLQLVSTIKLNHAAAYIHPYGEQSVLIMGTGHSPQLHTAYTIIESRNRRFVGRQHSIPINAWAYRWLGTIGGQEYFADPGGNVNDPDSDPLKKAQTIFAYSSRPRYLPVRMSLPTGGVAHGKNLFVVQKEAIGKAESNVGLIDVATQKLSYLFATYRNDLKDIVKVKLANKNLIAVSEGGADNVLLIDADTGVLLNEAKTDIGPRSLATVGQCLIVGNETSNSIQVINVQDPTAPKTMGAVTVDMPATEFKWLAKVEADAGTGMIFARSNYPCNAMAEECTDDWNRVLAFPAAELLQSCQ